MQKRQKYLRLLEQFRKYDKDGNGYISFEEMKEVFRLRGFDVHDPAVRARIIVRWIHKYRYE